MGNLIDDLLNFSRTSRTELRKSLIDMKLVLDEAMLQLETTFHGRNIDWKISPMPTIYGDYNLLRMVWMNLIDNSVKYTRPREKAFIEIGCSEEKHRYIFFVKDNGVGFDTHFAENLFGVFQRMHTSTEFEGTGIGLANVRRIISRHDGTTWAESLPGEGATFYFSVPKKSNHHS
jgi:light-regulated signal transduction histidine kinase (bacteriophytochrome)